MTEEKYMGFLIFPVKTFGVMEVYVRSGYRTLHVPKYVVFKNDRALEEFSTKRTAFKWARKNQNG